MDPENLRRRTDLPVGLRQHARDVARLDFREREQRPLRPVGERRFFAAELLGEVLGAQHVVRGHDHRSLDDVAQPADVPDPRWVAQPPERSISRSWTARRILACSARLISAISSRNNVPPTACSNRPILRMTAPVKAPFSCPNSSLSSRFSGIAAQLTATNAPDDTGPLIWIARATTSLPVPDSPCTSTVA